MSRFRLASTNSRSEEGSTLRWPVAKPNPPASSASPNLLLYSWTRKSLTSSTVLSSEASRERGRVNSGSCPSTCRYTLTIASHLPPCPPFAVPSSPRVTVTSCKPK
eukprot:768696-Hanusia_phi.AAC.4